jgi:two-component system, OmpR family, phosphate regulon sensor histidine kinase PhoR
MAERSGRRFSPLVVIAPGILLAAIFLGTYSYRYAAQLAAKSETTLVESYTLLGDQTRERIDNFIIDSDRAMFDLVDLEHPADFSRSWSYIVRVSPAIEAAVVLDENQALLPNGYVSKKKVVADAEAFKRLFLNKILPDLRLGDLKPDMHKHLHREYDGRDYLISFIKKERDGRAFYVALKISLEYLLKELFPTTLEPLQGKALYCVRDDHGRVVFGAPVGQPGKFLYERAFPTTLFMWRLQLAPLPAASLNTAEKTRRRSEYLLITLTLGIILAGTLFLLYVSSKDRRANQLKSDFISNVSHELKTPLSLIRMFGELLALGKLKSPEKAKEYADIITREAERLTRLIDNVLDFSRMERGRSAYDFQPGSLADVVERSLDVYRHRVEREGLKLVTKIDADLPPTLIDENAMTLLLLNLLENAVKYGRGEIAVYLTRVGSSLRLVVGDQGPGIPSDEQVRIFDRFYRTRQARQTNARGSGIGLSLVKHIAEAHGGTVKVESEPGEGAAFIVDLPLVERREAA